jgi:uncharacterized protein
MTASSVAPIESAIGAPCVLVLLGFHRLDGNVLTAVATAELLEVLARRLVDDPDAVRVEREERDDVVVLRLFVAKDDVGKVIGRQGRIARALRQLVRAAAGRQRKRVVLEIVD